jgi:replicative DNA helicase
MSLYQEYERQLMARIVSDPSVYYENAGEINEEMFTDMAPVFGVFVTAIRESKYPGIQRILASLPQQQQSILQAIQDIDYNIPVEELISELEEARKVRALDELMHNASGKITSEEKLGAITNGITRLYMQSKSQFEFGFDAAKEAIKALDSKVQSGIHTGYAYFDKLTGGLQPSDLVIIAAESSQGKTSLALNITDNILDRGKAVVFISLEMSKTQLMLRMISSRANIARNELTSYLNTVHQVGSQYQDLKFYIADVTNSNASHILGLIRSAAIRFNVNVAVIDYVQLVTDKSHNSREQEIGQIARSLKNLAKELNITIMALSQLSRPKMSNNHEPSMSRLRDSGQIEEAADIVWFVYRPETYGIEEYKGEQTRGLAEMIIAKGRNYGTGSWFARFEADTTKFTDRSAFAGAQDSQPVSADKAPF